ncbi:hypothetical protein WA026_001583 [Henosepilachna vigintioctopunctata]|uniref:BLUF domain-containing protein n=1 Tax=Henosepilachna vigintioctopunctata TaxID=420089 RepID=A0AAW1UV08_9CUCU
MSSKFYNRKNIVRKRSHNLGISEPVRESLLDVLSNNLDCARKNIYVHRIIYLGEHSFDSPVDGVSDVFKSIVNEINGCYNDEPLTGVFLHYKKFFVHMLEGSEDSFMKHFQILMDDEVYEKFSNMKLVIIVNHINQRFIEDWLDIPGKPATLLEKIDPDSDMEKSGRYVFNCVQKVYQLCREIREIQTNSYEHAKKSSSDVELQSENTTPNSTNYEERLKAYYPEINLLQFLVQTKFLKHIDHYFNSYGFPNISDTYQDEVWPAHSTMVPYNIFDKPLDPCVDLPTHKPEQEEEIIIADEEAPPE